MTKSFMGLIDSFTYSEGKNEPILNFEKVFLSLNCIRLVVDFDTNFIQREPTHNRTSILPKATLLPTPKATTGPRRRFQRMDNECSKLLVDYTWTPRTSCCGSRASRLYVWVHTEAPASVLVSVASREGNSNSYNMTLASRFF